MESPACGKTVRRILRKARDGALLSLLMPAHAALQTGADIYNSPTARILRIPTKSAGDSERRRPPIPIEAGQGFR